MTRIVIKETNNMRKEKEVFSDLSMLCSLPGYAHIIAYFCFRDNVISYKEKLKGEDTQHLFSMARLVRTEISTLVGLLFKGEIDLSLPIPSVFQSLIEQTEALLEEMHQSMISPIIASAFDPSKMELADYNPFANGSALRERMFYCGESAYNFQYRDFAPKKYLEDDAWFQSKKDFSVNDIKSIVNCISLIQNQKLNSVLNDIKKIESKNWTVLPAFIFSVEEIFSISGINKSIIQKVIQAFSPPEGVSNQGFKSLNDFNITSAYPLIDISDGNYLLFQSYSFVEAFYETPFYWMGEDKSYVNEAMKNRGDFTESFAAERLESVFGKNRVFKNIVITNSKKQKAGEIDILVVFANRAIVVQAKSKRLTLEARKGNDNQIKSDFKKSIQDSYNQGLSCSKLLTDNNYLLGAGELGSIEIARNFKEIYIFCVVSDHYPALSFQVRQFLKYEQTEIIMAPFVMDIFHLDVMCEMLGSPLYFLSYVNARSNYFERILSANELTVLAYHLKNNLWFDDEYTLIVLDENIGVDLDASMMVRRESMPGDSVPDGILTRFKGTTISKLIASIENLDTSETIDLGFQLLSLDEETVIEIEKGIDTITQKAQSDKQHHDLTIGFEKSGLTIHCNTDPINVSALRLKKHCELRKYSQKVETWFGVCISPKPDQSIRFGINLEYTWIESEEMNAVISTLPQGKNQIQFKPKNSEKIRKSKIQENKKIRKIAKSSRRKNRRNK